MDIRSRILTALCVGLAVPAAAGQRGTAEGGAPQPAATVEVSRLPINLSRIGRQIREAEVREERNGLRLRYTLNVFGERPRIQFITPLDDILLGDNPRSAPTHQDMIRMMTPQEFRGGGLILGTFPRKK